MLLRQYELFIFDWDGTLSTSTSLVSISRLFKRRYNVEYIREHASDYQLQSAKNIKVEEEVNRLYARLYDIYSFFSRPKLQAGAIELLRELKRRGKKVAIFSDSNKYRLMKEIHMLKVADYVDFALSAASITRYKPNPQGLMVITQKFEMKKSQCLYIGDMASDILTARFARIDVATVGNGVDPYRLLKRVGPDFLFRNLVELRARLKR